MNHPRITEVNTGNGSKSHTGICSDTFNRQGRGTATHKGGYITTQIRGCCWPRSLELWLQPHRCLKNKNRIIPRDIGLDLKPEQSSNISKIRIMGQHLGTDLQLIRWINSDFQRFLLPFIFCSSIEVWGGLRVWISYMINWTCSNSLRVALFLWRIAAK